jgi:hypothetical protein
MSRPSERNVRIEPPCRGPIGEFHAFSPSTWRCIYCGLRAEDLREVDMP